jgi:hypothetical protein
MDVPGPGRGMDSGAVHAMTGDAADEVRAYTRRRRRLWWLRLIRWTTKLPPRRRL